MKETREPSPTTKLGNDHRPENWQTARFWQDEGKWYHPVALEELDEVPVHGRIPSWVYERRGQEPPAPEAPRSIEAMLAEGYNLTDLGNAERLVKHYGSIIHYCEEFKGWLIWDNRRWERDYGAKINALAELTTRQIYSEATDELDSKRRKALADHGKSSESDHRLTAMAHRAQSQVRIPVRANDLDGDPFLFNVLNGTINLKTGELLPHDRGDLLTALVSIKYDPKAKCPMWLNFLQQITDDDQSRIDYLQRSVGYSLTGDNRSQVLFFLWGLGNNGKSTLIATIRKLTGDYGARVSSDVFMIKDKAGTGPKEGLANLRGKRFACCSELEDGKKLAVSLIKDLTGGETITVDRKYEHLFEYLPTAKLWLVGNHKPVITDTTLSIWRRMKLIPFNYIIPKGDIDPELPQKLETELPGILVWAVKGCLSWQGQGLREPQAVIDATAIYRHDQDILGDFIEDCCTLEHLATIPKAELKDKYHDWCKTTGLDPVSNWTFKHRLVERGVTDGRSSDHKTREWRGIRLKTNEEVDKMDKTPPTSLKTPTQKGLQEEFAESSPNLSNLSKKPLEDIPEYPTNPCSVCGSGDYWLSSKNKWLCSKCHPEPKEGN